MSLTQAELARRLREAREATSFTQEQVGQRLGIPRSAVAQIELGNRAVGSLELGTLAGLYGLSVEDLLSSPGRPSRKLALFRASLEAAGAVGTFEVLQGLAELVREVARLERSLRLDDDAATGVRYELPPPRSRFHAIRQGLAVADQERARVGLGDAPIADIADFLDGMGVRAALLDLPDDVSGLTLIQPDVGPFVVVNATEAKVRRTFSFAHEYAHVLLDREAEAIVSRDEARNDLIEIRANSFAANLLMPSAGVRRFLASIGKGARFAAGRADDGGRAGPAEARSGAKPVEMHDLVLAARHFGVSRQVAAYRMRNLDILSERELRRLLDLERAGLGRDLDGFLSGGEVDRGRDQRRFEYRILSLVNEGMAGGLIDRRRATTLVGFLGTFTGRPESRGDLVALLGNDRLRSLPPGGGGS